MAGGDVPRPEYAELRLILGAFVLRIRAPGAEPAARRRADRAGQLALDPPQLRGQRRLGVQLRDPVLVRPAGPATAQFDKLGQLHAAFSILQGGYVVYESAGKEQQKFGDEFPQWRREMKGGPLARTRRRLGQAADF